MNLPTVAPGATVELFFESFAGTTGAPVTVTNLAVGDILVYKDGGTTQRASTSGFTLLDTDGVDFDSITGIHGVSVNLADNTTAGFWSAGSRYEVIVSPVTVDSQAMSFRLGRFRIGFDGAIRDTTIATLASQTSFTLTAGPTNNNALKGCRVVVTDPTGATVAVGMISAYTGSTKTVTLAFDPGAYTMAAGDNVSILPADFADLRLISGSAIDTASAQIGVNAVSIANNAITAAAIATDAIDADAMADGAITTGALADGAITAAKIAADAITASSIATGAIDADALATDAVAEIRTGLGLAAANLDTQLSDIQSAVDLISTGSSAPVIHQAPYRMGSPAYPDQTVELHVGDTLTLRLNLYDDDGEALALGTDTVAVASYTLAGALVSSVAATVVDATGGVVTVVVPSAWTATAGTYNLYAIATGTGSVRIGPLPLKVRAL